jgi:Zn finger protein HypA/HybF involved in hydrogenase expression
MEKHLRPFNLIMNDVEQIFVSVRKYLKYCSNCKNKINVPFTDFHLPLCSKCRELMIKDARKNWIKKLKVKT